MRLSNWPRLLSDHIEARTETPFAWGTHDCLLWAASCVAAITGKDPAADLRGTYHTAIGAYRLIKYAGGFEQLIESRLDGGAKSRTHRNLAQRGDVVTCMNKDGRMAAGIWDGQFGVFAGPIRMSYVRRNELNLRAWRVD